MAVQNILWFKDISSDDTHLVGGKNASLGEMYSNLTERGINIPNGFAVTAEAYESFLKETGVKSQIKEEMKDLDTTDVEQLEDKGKKIRKLIYKASLPEDIKKHITSSFKELRKKTEKGEDLMVAVRSSATAEDLPRASFAGQQDSFLNISTEKYLIKAVKKCMASIFSDRAISYREKQGFDHLSVSCSVGIQQMVDAEEGSAGVMFTMDTESGFDGVVLINSSYGYGEYVVKGRVTPDQFYVFKDGLNRGKNAVIDKKCGSKEVKLIKGKNRDTKQKRVKKAERQSFSIDQEDILKLAEWGVEIEEYYGRPQDIEWVKDGETGELYIVQSRPETVESNANPNSIDHYFLKQEGDSILSGTSIGRRIGSGKVRVLESSEENSKFKQGDVLVTSLTNPDWEPIMSKASAIITEQGGKTSHAAIVSRELGIPAVVGAENAIEKLEDIKEVTVDCSQGEQAQIYEGLLPYEVNTTEVDSIPKTDTDVLLNIGNPDHAFNLSNLPIDGVGLARTEFIFNDSVKIHPLALAKYDELDDKKLKKKIDKLTPRHKNKKEYCVDKLSEGIAKVATAFYPKKTVVRLSDFKTNEYKKLLGGEKFEPDEQNPMMGWRGASRYYSDDYKPAFELECRAIKKVREEIGLDNVVVMVPFCRTPEEGRKVLDTMEEFGLKQGEKDLKVYAMCEIPSNVVLADEFAQMFDGISIGSNDLTQFALGQDRDSASVSEYDANAKPVREMIKEVIETTHDYHKEVSICGQAPSDSMEFTKFLVRSGIDSISLNPDVVLQSKKEIGDIERTVGNTGDKTNTKLLALLIIVGLLSALLIAMGAGCSRPITGSDDIDQENFVDKNNFNPSKIRQAATERAVEKMKEKQSKQRNTLQVRTFATFTLKYPVGWSVKQGSEKVKLYNSKQDSEFLEVLTRIDEADDDSETSTPSNKFDSKEKIKLPASEDLDEDQEKYLILRGNSKEYFADIVESVKLEDSQTTDGE